MKTQDIKSMGLAWRQVLEAGQVKSNKIDGMNDDKSTIKSFAKKHGVTAKMHPSDHHSHDYRVSYHGDHAAVKSAVAAHHGDHDTAKDEHPHLYSKKTNEAVGTATHKPNNGQDPEQGLSPNAKKEKARTSGVGVDANDSIVKSFKAFRANSKTAKLNGGMGIPGDKAIIKSTMAPAANQKTEAVDVVAEVKQGKSIKGKIGDPIKAAYHGEEKKKNGMHKMPDGSMMKDDDPSMKKEMMKKKPVKAAYHSEEKKKAKKDDKLDDGDGMDPVGKADADIDNDGDVDKTDNYLNNRRDAIRAKMKGKGKKEDAVMHGGKGGTKSEKKEKETMGVGEGAMKRMSTGDGMDTYKKKPKDEAFSSRAIVKKDRRGDGKPMGDPRQMKDPKKDSMVSKDGKVKVIDKDKEKDHLKKGFVRAEMNDMPKTMKRPAMPQKGLMPPAAKKGSPY